MEHKTEDVAVKALTVHPLAQRLPMLAPDNPRFRELVAGVAEHGVLQAVVIDTSDRLLVGRHRLEAARVAGLETIPATRIETDDSGTAALILQENMARQEMTQSKRALMIVALHEEFFQGRKARRVSNGPRHAPSVEVHSVNFDRIDVPENPFDGVQNGLVHGDKWKAMPLNIKQLAASYGVAAQYLVWAAHLWDERDGDAAPLIAEIWQGEMALGAAYAGLMGGKPVQRKRQMDAKLMIWVGDTRRRIVQLATIKNQQPDLFDKYHEDLLELYKNLRLLLDISVSKTSAK